jgi:hypothetical protein
MSEPEQVTIRNSMPNILANEAYGSGWKRTQDVMVVNTAGGTATHLSLKSGSGTTSPEKFAAVYASVLTVRRGGSRGGLSRR